MTNSSPEGVEHLTASESPDRERAGRSVLFVSTVPITITTFLIPFARDLRGRGWRVEAAAADLPAHLRPDESFSAVHHIGFSRRALAVGSHLRAWWSMRRLLFDRRPDVVHLHTPIASVLTRFAVASIRRSHRPKVVYVIHGFHFYDGGPRSARKYERLERLVERFTDVVFTINDEDTVAAEQIFRGEVHRLPGIGIDLSHYSPDLVAPEAVALFRQANGLGDDTFAVLVVATLEVGKQHGRLLRALQLTPESTVALLAGTGPLRSELERQVADAGLSSRVRFLGQVDDIRVPLRSVDCCVLPSEREGLPRSIIEAMAMGTPVVGSDIRGVRDLLVDGAGVLVDTSDASAFAAALDQVASEPGLAARLVETASLRVAQLSEEHVLRIHGAVFDRLAGEG